MGALSYDFWNFNLFPIFCMLHSSVMPSLMKNHMETKVSLSGVIKVSSILAFRLCTKTTLHLFLFLVRLALPVPHPQEPSMAEQEFKPRPPES